MNEKTNNIVLAIDSVTDSLDNFDSSYAITHAIDNMTEQLTRIANSSDHVTDSLTQIVNALKEIDMTIENK